MAGHPINRDGGVWRLRWEREPDSTFRAWVERFPKIEVRGSVWDEVEDRLFRRIDEELHAGEWTADWSPPRPGDGDPRYWTDPTFVTLAGEGRHTIFNNPATLFQDGLCDGCPLPRGPRTSVSLVAHVEINGGIAGGFMSFLPDIFRRDAVETLGPANLGGAEVREVSRLGRGRIKFVELVPSQPLPIVSLRGQSASGWRCTVCDRTYFSNLFGQADYRSLVAASRLPTDATSFWLDDVKPQLCVRHDWWSTVRDRSEFRGVISHALWVVRDDSIDPLPGLKRCDWARNYREGMTNKLIRYAEDYKLDLPAEVRGWISSP